MSTLTGIDKISRSASLFVDVASFDMIKENFISEDFLNVEYLLNNSYTSVSNSMMSSSKDFINVQKTLSNPASGKVNLNFSYIFVNDQNTRQVSNTSSLTKKSIIVKNDIAENYTKASSENTASKSKAFVNVLTSNTEFSNTLDLDSKIKATVFVVAPSASAHVPVVIDLNDEWT
jgi:hypothetical protein